MLVEDVVLVVASPLCLREITMLERLPHKMILWYALGPVIDLLRLRLQVGQPRLLPEGAAELRARGIRADADELVGQGLLQGQAGEGAAEL